MTAPNHLSSDEHTLLMLILGNIAYEMRNRIAVDRSYFYELTQKG